MEPRIPSPNHASELPPPSYPGGHEQIAGENVNTDREQMRSPEHHESSHEVASAPATPVPILPPPQVAPMPSAPVADDTSTSSDDDLPVLANDDDLIEKEWVDKAKKIITETRDDPYRREEEVSRLQADYLQKRYGRELDAS